MSLSVISCAKINLTLDVFSLRPDGYHGVASVMQAISLHDTLTLERTDAPGVSLTCPQAEAWGIPLDASNLAARGAQAVLDASGAGGGIHITLDKCVPAQAGLGGGSSNAAAALVGANNLLGAELDAKQLHGLAASLGSDVPFFLLGGTAEARGRGEILTPLDDAPTLWLVIVKPEESVSTGWAYGQLDADPARQSHRGTKRLVEALKEGDAGRVVAFQSNDFELPVFRHFPKLAWLHDELTMAGALAARLCGSGAALYGVAQDEAAARRIAALLSGRYPHVAVARTLSRAESDPLARPVEVAP